jgi:hypothetical protein
VNPQDPNKLTAMYVIKEVPSADPNYQVVAQVSEDGGTSWRRLHIGDTGVREFIHPIDTVQIFNDLVDNGGNSRFFAWRARTGVHRGWHYLGSIFNGETVETLQLDQGLDDYAMRPDHLSVTTDGRDGQGGYVFSYAAMVANPGNHRYAGLVTFGGDESAPGSGTPGILSAKPGKSGLEIGKPPDFVEGTPVSGVPLDFSDLIGGADENNPPAVSCRQQPPPPIQDPVPPGDIIVIDPPVSYDIDDHTAG